MDKRPVPKVSAFRRFHCSDNPEPPHTKKCALEKLLGSTFSSVNPDSWFPVSFNELVQAELSRYKSEPVVGLKKKPLEWRRAHHQSYPHLAKVEQKYLGVVAWEIHQRRGQLCAGLRDEFLGCRERVRVRCGSWNPPQSMEKLCLNPLFL